MKKFYSFVLLLVLVYPSINAQFTKAGGGLAYGSGFYFNDEKYSDYRSGHIAVSFKGIYEITLPIHISPSFTVFYPNITKAENYRSSIFSMMFDVNGHYVFNSLDRFEFYGLAGLNILLAREKSKSPGFATFKQNDNALGLNVGAGTYIKISDQFDAYVEAKYIISRYDQFMLNAGVLVNIDWLIKHEKKILN
ncbi:MAG TPA: outer membrane beta-barrel protein [Bacteroidales bacterium]|jgi:opacity protein-like surface antigen|nr:outer membrane beta-barrel protein [Bacteroidales bacterium]OQB64545.1 MAG: hypothetical protein BWX96_00685 [Bacteroidetes bacterium ADurb.Bin145]HOU01001.1 outer membrane beta-barrel protein [Bacteroidales bacterium]HQG62228.1 outer membrane beta-barrel protein [Bacteroidales bacterium]HQK66608.1 outer membrane beta-barrel protein [Bacteroidales bacterium]